MQNRILSSRPDSDRGEGMKSRLGHLLAVLTFLLAGGCGYIPQTVTLPVDLELLEEMPRVAAVSHLITAAGRDDSEHWLYRPCRTGDSGIAFGSYSDASKVSDVHPFYELQYNVMYAKSNRLVPSTRGDWLAWAHRDNRFYYFVPVWEQWEEEGQSLRRPLNFNSPDLCVILTTSEDVAIGIATALASLGVSRFHVD